MPPEGISPRTPAPRRPRRNALSLLLCLTIFALRLAAAEDAQGQPKRGGPTKAGAGRAAAGASQREPAATLEEATALNRQSVALYKEGKYREALALAERALTIRERLLGPGHHEVGLSLSNVAKLYERLHELDKAEPLFLRSIAVIEKALGPHIHLLAPAVNNLGDLYFTRGEYAKAAPLYQRAASIMESWYGPGNEFALTSLNSLARTHKETGDYARAEELFLRVLAQREKSLPADHTDTAHSHADLGLLYRFTGGYDKAEEHYRRALAVYEKRFPEGHPDYASALHNLALLHRVRGDLGRAEPLYRQSLAMTERVYGPDHPAVAATLSSLATLNVEWGEEARAEELYRRALAIDEKAYGPEHSQVALDLNNLAEFYRGRADYARAEPLYLRSAAAYEKSLGPDHASTAVPLNNLGLLYRAKGDEAKAVGLYRRALAVREKALGPDHTDVAASLSSLAFVHRARGEFDKAEPLYLRALAIDEKAHGPNHLDVAATLGALAALHAAKGEAARAVEYKSREEEALEYNIALVLAVGSERQKLSYLGRFVGATYAAVSLHARSFPADAAAARLALTAVLRRKGRALDAMSEQVASLRRRLDAQDRDLLDRLAEAQSRLSALTLGGRGDRARASKLEAEIEGLQDAVGRRSAEFRARALAVNLERVRQSLPEGAALVEYVYYSPVDVRAATPAARFGPERYAAYVLRREGEPLWADLGEAATIEAEVALLRAALKDPRSKNARAAARALDERVMRPVRKLLGPDRRVFVSPDGALNLVPFAALVDEGDRHLVETHTLTYLSSGRDLLRLQAAGESREPPLVVADPIFGEKDEGRAGAGASAARGDAGGDARRSADMSAVRFDRLPGTAEEAKALAAAWPEMRLLTEGRATETALKRVAGPRVLHVATHGFFLPDQPPDLAAEGTRGLGLSFNRAGPARVENPLLRSGLALEGANRRRGEGAEDGILTALEAAGLDLWGTKLVVLSACETGVGEVRNGEGVYGLRRALVLAGSESQVMSLWQVSDAATRELMVGYYERLRAGEGRTEALRQVQLGMLKGVKDGAGGGNRRDAAGPARKTAAAAADYSHPYYWAGFIQSGDWRAMNAPVAVAPSP